MHGPADTLGAARRHLLRALSLAGLLLAVACGTPSTAGANAFQESIVQDDRLLLYSGDTVREETLDELQAIGADTIRAFASWSAIAPNTSSTTRPAFDAANPAAYPAGAWDPFDDLVRSVSRRGLRMLLTPTSPIPAWASECRASVAVRRTCSPNPTEYGRFVIALALRYSGSYRDENQGENVLPRVSRWAIWNEPNLATWLSPQYVVRGRTLVPASAYRYRLLAAAAIGALRAAGHGSDLITIGETGPIGHIAGPLSRRPVATAEFFRGVFCIDRFGRSLTGLASLQLGCRRPTFLAASGIAHHPYVQGGSRSPLTPARFDEIHISSVSRLKAIMAQAAARGRIRRGLGIYYTEFGFQTRPPDRVLGVPLAVQASYLNQSEYIAFRDPAIRGVGQYLLRDDPGLSGFQSGLRFINGASKPGLHAYRFPIWVVRSGIFVTVFGQIRAAADGTPGTIRVQVRLPGRPFTTYRTVQPNRKGFVLVRLRSRRGRWRLYWEPANGDPVLISRETQEAPR